MQIFIKNIAGKTITLDLGDDSSVKNMMRMIMQKEGIPTNEIRLIYAGKQLQEGLEMSDYGITDLSTVHMGLRLPGGEGGK